MSEVKTNNDGLVAGSLVSEKDHLRITNEERKKSKEKAKAAAELAAKAAIKK